MTKNTILQHKIEKEKMLSENYIFREKLDFAKSFLNSVFSFLLEEDLI